MEVYSASLLSGGIIMFSGFYIFDLNDIKAKALECNLEYQLHLVKNDWVAAKFIKK